MSCTEVIKCGHCGTYSPKDGLTENCWKCGTSLKTKKINKNKHKIER